MCLIQDFKRSNVKNTIRKAWDKPVQIGFEIKENIFPIRKLKKELKIEKAKKLSYKRNEKIEDKYNTIIKVAHENYYYVFMDLFT